MGKKDTEKAERVETVPLFGPTCDVLNKESRNRRLPGESDSKLVRGFNVRTGHIQCCIPKMS